ncbi:hypothetical protein AAVH_33825, partial [Aphelenchoides avenae]
MIRAFILALVATAAALPAKRNEEKPTYYSDEEEDISETELGGHGKNNEPIDKDEIVYPNEDYASPESDFGGYVIAAPKSSKYPSRVTVEINAAKPQAGNPMDFGRHSRVIQIKASKPQSRLRFGRYGHLRESNKQPVEVNVIKTLKPPQTPNKVDVELMA